jgi:hypothetical protein
VDSGVLPAPVPSNPAMLETPGEKAEKYRNWDKTLDNLQENLE